MDLAPWNRKLAQRVLAVNAVSLALMVGGWWGLSTRPDLVQQLPYINVAAAGLVLSGLANTGWILAGRRAVIERAAAVEQHAWVYLASLPATPDDKTAAGTKNAIRVAVSDQSVTRYHLSTCQMVQGKSVERLTGDGARGRSLRPCEICTP